MSERNEKASTGDDSNGYEVGYGKPPAHSRFQPGQSGNRSAAAKGCAISAPT
jgi:hypothetical protein